MPKASPAYTNFNGGEASPRLEGRTDIQKYNAMCHTLENFIPTVQGPVRRRPGTRFVKEVKNSAIRGWLSEFSFAVGQGFILEWGNSVLRFYTNGGALLEAAKTITGATSANPVVITSVAHGFSNGDEVFIAGVVGEVQLNGRYFLVAGAAANTFQLHDIDGNAINGTAYSAYTSGGTVARVYQIASPYLSSDLTDGGYFALRYAQSGDVIRITNTKQTFVPYKLSRLGNTNWTLVAMPHKGGPFAPLNNIDAIVVYASAETGVGITLTASAAIWKPGHVGALFYLEQNNIRDVDPWEPGKTASKGVIRRYNGVQYEAIQIGVGAMTGSVPPTHTSGAQWDGRRAGNGVLWDFRDAGYGHLTITAVAAAPAGSAKTITGATAANPVVITSVAHGFSNGDIVFISGVLGMIEINNRWFQVNNVAANTFELRDATGTDIDGTQYTAYSSGGTADIRKYTATATVLKRLPLDAVGSDNASPKWAMGAWNDIDGYPSAVGFFRDRLTFARDDAAWASVSADFENFNAKTDGGIVTADMAISFPIPSQNSVESLTEGTDLIILGGGGEFIASQVNAAQPVGPANLQIKPQSHYGSAPVQAVRVGGGISQDASTGGGALLFVQLGGRKVREIRYQFYTNSYSASDVTTLAEHVTQGGILQMAFQREPDPVLWAVRADGMLLGFTYEPEQSVTGWHRHPLGGGGIVESIAVIPAPDGSQDQVWLQVRRTINGHTRRYIEYIVPHFMTGDVLQGAFYVDCGLTYNGAATMAISGLSHLEGQLLDVLADGMAHAQETVVNGVVTLERLASVVQVGLPEPCKLITMRIEAGAANGTAQAKIKRINGFAMRFLNTLGGKYGPEGGTLDTFEFRTPDDTMDDPVPLFAADGSTADMPFDEGSKLTWPDGYSTSARIEYFNDQPFPVTIVAIYPDLETQEGG